MKGDRQNIYDAFSLLTLARNIYMKPTFCKYVRHNLQGH